jgi:flagellar hook-basal body complex protein FliE
MNKLTPISPLKPLQPLESKETAKFTPRESDFSAFLKNSLDKLEASQQEAEKAAVDLVTGKVEDFHTPIIALEKASMTLGLAVTIRNKVLEAYHEIMRMQI